MTEPTEPTSHHRLWPFSTEAEGSPGLRDYWRILNERRAVILGTLGIVVATTLVLSFLATPQYRSKAVLQIERQGPDILTFKDVLGVDPAGYLDFYQTQYKILQSRTVLRKAVERLDLVNRPEFATRKGSPAERLAEWAKGLLRGDGDGPADPLEPALDFVEDEIAIEPVRNSHLVRVAFTDRDPRLATDVANAVAEAYIEFQLDARYSTTATASDFLTKQVTRLQAEIGDRERQLQAYGQKSEILALSDGAQDISEKALGDLNGQLIQARGRLALAEARFDTLRNAPADALQEVLNSPLVNNLKGQYAEVERRHSQMAERFKEDWPALRQTREEMERARARLETETETIARRVREVAQRDVTRARAEVARLGGGVEDQKHEVQRVNRAAIEYGSIKAEIATRRKVLEDLVARQSQTETSGQLRETSASNVRVVDRAEVPKEPSSPKKKLNLLLAILLGLTAGVGFALVLDHLDNTVRSEQDIERHAPVLALLGHLPLYEPLRAVEGSEDDAAAAAPLSIDLASHVQPRSSLAEAFKNLRTSLLLASPEHPPRRILLTSCEPGDGKSTAALNLAIVLAQMGRRVVLVDADLRRPRIHKMVGCDNTVGLTTFLTGNAGYAQTIQGTGIPNLWVVPSGPIPPNPSELLNSPSLESLLDRLDRERGFDHILFDSPPVLQVADSVILAQRMDATVLVVRASKTTRTSLVQGVARLRQSRARVAGVVLNAVPEKTGYYYYRYYRYYRSYRDETSEKTAPARARRRRDRRQASQA